MSSFRNDYGVLAHPSIMEALCRYASEINIPYGLDYHSLNASNAIKRIFGVPDASVHFLPGGTSANKIFLSYALRSFEAVLSPSTGHINVHEAGAIESSGHKIVTVPSKDGKLPLEEARRIIELHSGEHMVKIKAIYISNSTETGSIYSRQELLDLRSLADECNLYLFIDGARLGNALTSIDNDATPELLGDIADAFVIGGTKNGLIFGEALVVANPSLTEGFRNHIKLNGGMMAKGYAAGIMFEEAFRDGLYFELARHSNEVASYLLEGLKRTGFDVLDSPTNQVFATFPKDLALAIIKRYGCEKWEEEEDRITIRFVTSFASKKEEVDELLDCLSCSNPFAF